MSLVAKALDLLEQYIRRDPNPDYVANAMRCVDAARAEEHPDTIALRECRAELASMTEAFRAEHAAWDKAHRARLQAESECDTARDALEQLAKTVGAALLIPTLRDGEHLSVDPAISGHAIYALVDRQETELAAAREQLAEAQPILRKVEP